MTRERQHIFHTAHPVVLFLYFLGVILFGMMTFQPFFVCVNFTVGSVYHIYLHGARAYFRAMRYSIVLLAVITIGNALFNGMGETVLFFVGETAMTWEALLFGLCAGGMFASILLWFANYRALMTSDRFLYLFSSKLPILSMTICMIIRLVPEMAWRTKEIMDARAVEFSSHPTKRRIAEGIKVVSVLMEWSMENGLQTAESMKARCYGMCKRTSFHLYSMGKRDWITIVGLIPLLGLNGFLIVVIGNSYLFYPIAVLPSVSLLVYFPYILFLGFPLILEGIEQWQWRQSR